MRIGIITYWQTSDNYGQVLQCFALQHILREAGHDVFIIRYDLKRRKRTINPVKRIARILLYPLRVYKIRKLATERHNRELVDMQRQFDVFRDKYFHYSSDIYTSLKQLRKNPPQADLYVAGSDQIWGQLLSEPENEVFYLNFGGENIKRISIAVSFGMKEYPPALKERLKLNLTRFNCVSCRETDGVKICADVGIIAERIVDPTLMLTPYIYDGLLPKKTDCGRYIYLYSINVHDSDELRYPELKKFAETVRWSIIVTTASGYIQGKELYGDVPYQYASIGEWLAYIKNTMMVVTPSFHGIVFSILFHRPFVYVPLEGNASRANNRIMELLTDLGLQNHILTSATQYEQLSIMPYDWQLVDNRLNIMRSIAIAFLCKNGILATE